MPCQSGSCNTTKKQREDAGRIGPKEWGREMGRAVVLGCCTGLLLHVDCSSDNKGLLQTGEKGGKEKFLKIFWFSCNEMQQTCIYIVGLGFSTQGRGTCCSRGVPLFLFCQIRLMLHLLTANSCTLFPLTFSAAFLRRYEWCGNGKQRSTSQMQYAEYVKVAISTRDFSRYPRAQQEHRFSANCWLSVSCGRALLP